MPTAENKLDVVRFIEETVNTGEVDRIADFISHDYLDSYDKTEQSNGLAG